MSAAMLGLAERRAAEAMLELARALRQAADQAEERLKKLTPEQLRRVRERLGRDPAEVLRAARESAELLERIASLLRRASRQQAGPGIRLAF